MTQRKESLSAFLEAGEQQLRWTDKACPLALTEADKHAVKAILCFFLYELFRCGEPESNVVRDAERTGQDEALLQSMAYSYIMSLKTGRSLCKFYAHFKSNMPDAYRDYLTRIMNDFKQRLIAENSGKADLPPRAQAFLSAANTFIEHQCSESALPYIGESVALICHQLSTQRELQMLRPLNPMYGAEMDATDAHIKETVSQLYDGASKLPLWMLEREASVYSAICLLEQARFRKWKDKKESALSYAYVLAMRKYIEHLLDPDGARSNGYSVFYQAFFTALISDIAYGCSDMLPDKETRREVVQAFVRGKFSVEMPENVSNQFFELVRWGGLE